MIRLSTLCAALVIGSLELLPAQAANPPDASLSCDGQPYHGAMLQVMQPIRAPYTVEFWAKPTANSDHGFVRGGVGLGGFNLYLTGVSNLLTSFGDGNAPLVIEQGATIPNPIGRWTHFAAVITASTWTLYADGVSVAGGSFAGSLPTLAMPGTGLLLGTAGEPSFDLTGRLDEFRVWNVARTASEIATNRHQILAGNEPGLIGLWRFTEGSGGASIGVTAGDFFQPDAIVQGGWAVPGAPVGGPGVATGPSPTTFPTVLTATAETTVPATAWIDYGPPGALTNRTGLTPHNPTATQAFSLISTATLPRGMWSFRGVASNQFGINVGVTRTFTSLFETNQSQPLTVAGLVSAADLNGDGWTEVISGLAGATAVLFGGPGGFGSLQQLSSVFPGALADLDGDGITDLLGVGFNLGTSQTSYALIRGTSSNTLTTALFNAPGPVGALAFADLNGDGRPDLLASGANFELSPSGLVLVPSTKTLINQGGLTYTAQSNNLPVLGADLFSLYTGKSRLVVGDFEGAGQLGVVLGGSVISSNYCGLWHHDGNGHFTETNSNLAGEALVETMTPLDYDGDGRLDLLLGINGLVYREARLLHNDGSGQFSAVQSWFSTANNPLFAAVADFDNNGTPDLFLGGNPRSGLVSSALWRNAGNHFEALPSALDTVTNVLTAAWLDADRDGDLDIIISPAAGTGSLFFNLLAASNTPPTAPGPIATAFANDTVGMNWGAATDAETPAAWLTYNVRIGTTPGGSDFFAPTHGAPGNVGSRRSFTFRPVAGRTYYASVQAVDSQNLAGPWSPEVPMRFDLVRTLGGGAPVPGDINGDGFVSLEELNTVIQAYRGLRH